jgi:hypothetical protein
MSVLNDLFDAGTYGESSRLDALVREHDALQKRFDALVELLRSRDLLTDADIAGLLPADDSGVTEAQLDSLDSELT